MTPHLNTELSWSEWVPFDEALDRAPRKPGVYRTREQATGQIVYIGMAGERRGSNNTPQGIRGRLAVYITGKALASGLGEAVLDRALADPEWLRGELAQLQTSGASRAKQWGINALARANLEVRWTVTADASSARALERRMVAGATNPLWNKTTAKSQDPRIDEGSDR